MTTHRVTYKSYHHPFPTGWDHLYTYTADLMCLNSARPQAPTSTPEIQSISTPLIQEEWQITLARHPDRAFAAYITRGIRDGFRVGFHRDSPLGPAARNMPSALQHKQIISDYLANELARNRMLGPFPPGYIQGAHSNRIGVIPKGHNTGKWRLITDLSFPPGRSVNNGIHDSLCSLTYTTVDDIAARVTTLGQGTLLAKVDIEAAYRLVPIHPDDRPLLAINWEGHTYIDAMLPFGLCSAPKIFNAVADALAWHLHNSGVNHIDHYLDDFILLGAPNTTQCQDSLDTLDRECLRLGVPLAPHKRDGPTTCLTFLGIEIDTVHLLLRLPQDKLQRLAGILQDWSTKKWCIQRDLESLCGLLNHACKVVRAGRSFLRRMLDLLHETCHPPRGRIPIRINASFRSDLAWWLTFVRTWNGTSFLPPPPYLPKRQFTSDASGSWGCGAWHINSWFQIPWCTGSVTLSIAEKELLPIILACAAWGKTWSGLHIQCRCDNQVVVAGIRSRTSRVKGIMHLLRCLVFIEASYNFHLTAQYIDTHANHLADDLSRNKLSSFLCKVPLADPAPTPVSQQLWELLLNQQEDWTSPNWRAQFNIIFNRA